MTRLDAMTRYIDELLEPASYADYAPNGLQVAGKEVVHTLVTGVTASQALLEAAVGEGADAVLVHHGWFWKSEDPRIVGMKYRRLSTLMAHGTSLLAYHLPLDAHPELGNNARLARLLGLHVEGRFGPGVDGGIGMFGRTDTLDAEAMAGRIGAALGRPPLLIAGGDHPIRRIGWCSGAAQGFIESAAALGLDAYISGEISEPTVHIARELGIHYFAAGHHATERYGVQALGEHLARHFQIAHKFIDINHPV